MLIENLVSALPIFVAEDDEDDRLLLRDAFDEVDREARLRFAEDGVDLLKQLEFQSSGITPLIILDMNMPRMNGRETLRALRCHPVYGLAPVVVLSTSDAREDIDEAYALGANTYFTKPTTYRGLVDIIRSLIGYWQKYAKIPTPPSPNADPVPA